MALINYKDIDFKQSINKENKIINFNGSEIQIVNYLSINDKYDLIMITLQKAFDNGIYNDLKLQMFFDLNIVYMYTNILFNTEDRVNELDLYDNLKNSGLIDIIKNEIDKEELNELWNLLQKTELKLYNYKGSFFAFILNAIENLPIKAEKALNILKQIDPALLKTLNQGFFTNILSSSFDNFNAKETEIEK